MKIKYDGEGDTLDILLKEEGQIHHAEDYGQIIVNFDKNKTVVEIEILNASKFFGEFLTGMIQAKTKAKTVEITV